MKKILLLLLVVFLACGCTPVKESSIEEILNTALNSKYKLYNKVNRGYKYYLPRGLKAVKLDEYNVIIKSKNYNYYLYVDLVSYYNKVDLNYQQDTKLYYSELFDNGNDKFGIVDITEINDKEVIIEMSYHYADIAAKVKREDINEAILNMIAVVNSVTYQDDVIKSLLDEDVLSSTEEKIDVFKTEVNDTQTLDTVDDTYTGNEEEDYDPDVIDVID